MLNKSLEQLLRLKIAYILAIMKVKKNNKGPSINNVASLEGGQIDDMGRYEGGRCQRKSDIVNSRLTDYDFF